MHMKVLTRPPTPSLSQLDFMLLSLSFLASHIEIEKPSKQVFEQKGVDSFLAVVKRVPSPSITREMTT